MQSQTRAARRYPAPRFTSGAVHGCVTRSATLRGQASVIDLDGWIDRMPGRCRQIYDMPELNCGMGLAWSWANLIAGKANDASDDDLGILIVLRHNTVALALEDWVWSQYRLGELFDICDPETGRPAVRNPYWFKPGRLPVPDAGLAQLVRRGVQVTVCSRSIVHHCGILARKVGVDPVRVARDWIDAVHREIYIAPSGLAVCNSAVARGCTYVFAS